MAALPLRFAVACSVAAAGWLRRHHLRLRPPRRRRRCARHGGARGSARRDRPLRAADLRPGGVARARRSGVAEGARQAPRRPHPRDLARPLRPVESRAVRQSLSIDTTAIPPAQAAARIVAHYGLPPPPPESGSSGVDRGEPRLHAWGTRRAARGGERVRLVAEVGEGDVVAVEQAATAARDVRPHRGGSDDRTTTRR